MRRLIVILAAAALVPAAFGAAKGGLNTSHACGTCHRDIYRMWAASAHARALENPTFLDAFHDTEDTEGAEVATSCLKCHAPLASVDKDGDLLRKKTWEGVNCDVCHGITAVEVGEKGVKQTFDIGMTKRGPVKDAASSAHDVAFSDLHTQSLVCAGCHEFTSADGTPVLTTYSEWKASASASEGKTCQSCHMGTTRANVVDPKVKRIEQPVNLHEVPGGHSIEQLNKALRVSVESKREPNGLYLALTVSNKGAGHAVPTGMAGRKVILDLVVRMPDGKSFTDKREYSRAYVDAAGKPVKRDGAYFAKGVKLVGDTRIKAGEKRTEVFRFPVPPGTPVDVSYKLTYEHDSTGLTEGRTRTVFLAENRHVAP